jgi:hypothetical protein
MPPLIEEHIRRKVIQQWFNGLPRDKIAEENNVGAGTVTSIVSNYKAGLETLDFDSIRQLAVEARQHGWNFTDLASHARLYNYFIKSGASEKAIESFITKVSSNDIPHEKVVELVYQLYEISKAESIPLHEIPGYIKEKLQEKQKIDEEIKEAYAILQSKNVSIEAINEHIHLNEELSKYRLSTKDIRRLVNLLEAAKEYRYSPGKIVAKLRSIKGLENKENKLKTSCDVLSEQVKKCNNVLPLAQKIVALNIDIKQLLVFESTVNQLAKQYNLPPYVAAFRLFNDINDYNKIGGLKNEVSRLSQQIFVVNTICANQNKAMMAMINLQSRGITEEQIISLNSFLENNGYKISSYISTK